MDTKEFFEKRVKPPRNQRKSKPKDKSKDLWLKRLGEKLKEARLKSEKSQSQLAFEVGLETQNISRIERGVVNASIYSIRQICRALNIPMDKFIKSIEK